MKVDIDTWEDEIIHSWYMEADGRMDYGTLTDILWVAEQCCIYCILIDLVIDDNGLSHLTVRHGKWGTAAWLRSLAGISRNQLDIIEL